jgi:large subunit ribosomal protein L22
MASRAIQRHIRQSPRKMRLVVDTIRGKDVNEAYALLKFSKKRAAKQVEKVLRSAVANAEQDALNNNDAFDVDRLFVKSAIVNGGPTMWRYRAAALGRAAPIRKRTSHVEIQLAQKEEEY